MPTQQRTQAWIGDAVLALYAREWILKQPDISSAARSDAFTHLTANQFLASFGDPTAVEASIGQIYATQGLNAAFDWIEATLIPLYLKQRLNNQKNRGSYRKKAK